MKKAGLRDILNPRQIVTLIIVLAVLAPLAVIFYSSLGASSDVWQHLYETVLSEIVTNTLWLAIGVGCGTILLGTSLAVLTVFFRFPGQKFVETALILPLAIPTYVLGFVWIGLLDYSAALPTFLRHYFDVNILSFFQIRSRAGVIIVMTLSLYPYVYLLARNAFLTQPASMWEAAASLGKRSGNIVSEVAIPMAKPWIFAGMLLVVMETVADFGTVAVFNYDTFTTGIYKAWFGLFSLPAAMKLSSMLLGAVILFLFLEYLISGKERIYSVGKSERQIRKPVLLNGFWKVFAALYTMTVFLLSFMIPMVQLCLWSFDVWGRDIDVRYFRFFSNTIILAGLAAVFTCFASMILAYASRQSQGKINSILPRFATVGYAVPGAVLAVGIFSSSLWLDKQLINSVKRWGGIEMDPILTGSIFAMIFAYLVRFLAVAYKPINSAMKRITSRTEEVGRSLGVSGIRMIRKIHFPMVRGGVLTALLLVFIDVMKEMPITLMMRPFGWETLSVRIFEMTSEGEWERAALPAVVLVIAGLIPVGLLMQRKVKLTET